MEQSLCVLLLDYEPIEGQDRISLYPVSVNSPGAQYCLLNALRLMNLIVKGSDLAFISNTYHFYQTSLLR